MSRGPISLFNAATATARSNVVNTRDDASSVLSIITTGFTGTVDIQGSLDGTNWQNVRYVPQQGDGSLSNRDDQLSFSVDTGVYSYVVSGVFHLLSLNMTRSAGSITSNYYASDRVILPVVETSTLIQQVLDDVLQKYGSDGDIAVVLRSASLGATTALTGAVIGTPVTAATPANSLIVSNVTASGDIVFMLNDGSGNSWEYARFDASAKLLVFNEASADIDVRFETDGNANALVIDGGLNSVGLGAAPVGSGKVEIGKTLNFQAPGTALAVTSNTITPTKSYHLIDSSGGAVTVKTITAGGDGDLVIFQSNNANDVVFDETDNIVCAGGTTTTLAETKDVAMFVYSATLSKWCQVAPVATN